MVVFFFIVAEQYIYRPAFAFDWQQPPRFWSEAVQIPSNESVYLLGLHSGHYILANSLPPKPWVDNYPWVFEIPGMQEETIGNWEQNPPKFIIWQPPVSGNWYDIGTYQPQKLTEWIRENYSLKENNLWQKND